VTSRFSTIIVTLILSLDTCGRVSFDLRISENIPCGPDGLFVLLEWMRAITAGTQDLPLLALGLLHGRV